MKAVTITTGRLAHHASQRLHFRVRMCDGVFVEEQPQRCVVHVADEDLDHLVDTLLDTPGVLKIETVNA